MAGRFVFGVGQVNVLMILLPGVIMSFLVSVAVSGNTQASS